MRCVQHFWIVALANCLFCFSALAQMQVLESNIEGIKVGSSVSRGVLDGMPSFGRVKVILLPSYTTMVFEGKPSDQPYRKDRREAGAGRQPY